MKYLSVTVLALTIAGTCGRPQQPQLLQHPQAQHQVQPQAPIPNQSQPQPQGGNSTPIPIISQTETVGADGSFNYSYETGNGIRVEQGGYVKKAPESKALGASGNNSEESGDIQVIQGSYSYTAPDGQAIVLTYIADERGFQPEGDHIPTAPPADEGAARALAQQQQQQQQPQHLQQQQHQPRFLQSAGTQQYTETVTQVTQLSTLPTTQYP